MAGQQHDHDDDDFDDGPDDGLGDDDDGGGDGETGRIRTLDSLAEAIERLEKRVERAFGAGQPRGSRSQPGGSGSSSPMTQADNAYARRQEIREELAALKSQEKADAERGELMTRLGKVEKAMERAPRQFRRVENLMGWHKS